MGKIIFYKENLTHASTGKERENHKYIARVPIKGSFGKKPKYRYFYTMAEWRAYNNKSKKSSNLLKSGTNLLKSAQKSISNLGKSIFKKSSVEKGKTFVNKNKKQPVNSISLIIPTSTLRNAFDFVKNTVSNLFNKNDKNGADTEPKDHKYTNKVTLPDGKTRYFYSKDEYEDYMERLDYQKNEPGFMKKIKDIADNMIFDKHEDMEKINEDYSPYDDATSTNCANCSAAYELRRRGYDVEAEISDDSYNGRWDRIYDYFEEPKFMGILGDGSTVEYKESFVRKACSNGLSIADTMLNSKATEAMFNEHNYSASSIEKAILDNNPPGSRGFIDVTWDSGGAHSIVYEVTTDNKVVIRDSQTFDEYTLDELACEVNNVRIARTDNLKLKEGILNAVKENEDKKRNNFVDKNRLKRYYSNTDLDDQYIKYDELW